MYIELCTLYYVHCTMYIVLCALYKVSDETRATDRLFPPIFAGGAACWLLSLKSFLPSIVTVHTDDSITRA